MKKLNGKLIISALLAAAMMSASSVYAAAADYGNGAEPTNVTPEVANVLTDKDVSDAISEAAENGDSEITVTMEEDTNGNVSVQESAIAEIAGSDVAVTVQITSDSGEDYSVTIDPSMITEAKGVNLGMDITVNADENASVSGTDVPAGSIVISPKQKGDFGMTLQVNLSAATLEGIDQASAALYYIADNGDVTRMPDSALTFNSDGSASVFISHASQYVIADDSMGLIPDETDDEDYEESDDYLDDEDSVDLTDDYDDDELSDAGDADNGSQNNSKDDASITVSLLDDGADVKPGTGAGLALGALAVSAAAVIVTARKRK